MKSPKTRLLGFALLMLAAVPLNGSAQGLPDGAGKETVQQACTRCHLMRSVVVARHTRQEWDNIVTDMVGRGAVITEGEMATIAEYLAKAFPKDTNIINVNRATSKELATVLTLSAQEADALVRYREENGYFNKFQDL